MVVVYFGGVLRHVCHDGCQDAGLGSIELLPRHVPGVTGVDLLPEGRSLGHDFLDDVLTVHLHGRVVLFACHLGLPDCGEALVLLAR